MSILRIVIIASNARLAAALSGLLLARSSARGVICHEKPQRSLHQPQALSCPPLLTMTTSVPSWKVALATIFGNWFSLFSRRQVFEAAVTSLKTISCAVVGDSDPLVRT